MAHFSPAEIMGDPEESLADYLPIQPSTSEPIKREFKPWHKPRKQFIRRKQWCHEIARLLKNINFPPDNKVLRYLTLPSVDMLDVRVLANSLNRNDVKLKYLGFCNVRVNTQGDSQMSVSEADVKGLDKIDDTSIVVRDMLEMTGNLNSQAFKHLDNNGPYHVVNIDLCNHFAAPKKDKVYGCIDAIKSISKVQVEKSRDSWLFFLTTRIQPDYIDANHLKAFLGAIEHNIKQSPDFKNKFDSLFSGLGGDIISRLGSLVEALNREKASDVVTDYENNQSGMPPHISHEDFRKFFCVGFGKWLLAFLTTAIPQTKVEMLQSYFYSVESEGQEMLSLAYLCTPICSLPLDRFGLAGKAAVQNNNAVDEVALALELTRMTSELVDLDELLANNSVLMEKMTTDAMKFLRQACYDIEDYASFAAQ